MQLTLKQWFARFKNPELRAQLLEILASLPERYNVLRTPSATGAIMAFSWRNHGQPVIGGSWINLYLKLERHPHLYLSPPQPSALRLPDQRTMRKLLLLPNVCSKPAVLGLFEDESE